MKFKSLKKYVKEIFARLIFKNPGAKRGALLNQHNEVLINIPWGHRRKGPHTKRRSIRDETESHLYGNKLARKAFRGVMTLKCASK